ncbi:hypothetical protein GCM10010215_45860 [Streptomyces virginiae]|uniref:DUF397 domain-containing protein n=1 Tax=Streptomyces virginiae TaxID=1961 RepID=A0ABQ3NJJ2_STRVG|nr:hypothetical protein GCM10010215_45860 [Streptomyces virginiae]GHI12952.1 hypothetical protein Scinn_24150 [Streptomyces virginiae]GLV92520.1 hypothetical protein Slala04_39740 [Streptomyces lavendulae subsp. lavendulae]
MSRQSCGPRYAVRRACNAGASMYIDRPDAVVSGPQVEAPFSHLTAFRGGGSPVRRHPSFRTDDGKPPESAPRVFACGGAPVVLEPLPVPGGAFFILPPRSV